MLQTVQILTNLIHFFEKFIAYHLVSLFDLSTTQSKQEQNEVKLKNLQKIYKGAFKG